MSENKQLLQFFKDICLIPRKTGDEKAVSDYLAEFARKRGLEAEQDAHANLLIRKPATIPNYNGPTVIIQGHMDIVYEKNPDSNHRYEDGIHVIEKDGYLTSADGTTLGADNGLAVAYAMDLIARDDLQLPPLELLITTSEEVGLEGVKNLELTDVKGSYLINLDAEEEGVFFTSCAGGLRSDVVLPLEYEEKEAEAKVVLNIQGVSGGHSGLDIGLDKANSIKLLGQILYHTKGLAEVGLVKCEGKGNAIASKGTIEFYLAEAETAKLEETLGRLEAEMQREYEDTDQVRFEITREKCKKAAVYTEKTRDAITGIITLLPYGVLNRMHEDPAMVETSSNIGAIDVKDGEMTFTSSSRSSSRSRKEKLRDLIQIVADTYGCKVRFYGDYPQWEYRKNSKLRDICAEVYKKYSGKEAVFTGIHAGIECGYLAEKLGSEIDMISCGANLFDVHTPRERADVESFYRIEEVLIAVLEELGKQN